MVELKETQDRAEAHLVQVRKFFEQEKEKSDQRLLEEKERTSRRLNQMQEELEIKQKEDARSFEQEITLLQDQI